MEILSRHLRVICRQPSVSYHPKCSKIDLTHLLFADDLMIFTRGDVPSVQAVLDTLRKFAGWTGLHANTSKTEIYFGGIKEDIKCQILQTTGFSEGKFLFRYLGLPLNTARNRFDMYGALITKIQAAIQRPLSSKLLSYAGKVQLLNSIVFGIENFWCAGCLLPRSVIKLINRIEEGGFGIKELLSWNKTLLSKWIWLLDLTLVGIWSRWTKAYNLKSGTIWDTTTKDQFSESMKGILAVKNDMIKAAGSLHAAEALMQIWCVGGKYHIQSAYHWFRLKFDKLPILKAVYGKAVEPRHALIASLAVQKRLATVDTLQARGLIIVNRCILCGNANESHSHLFFKCPYSQALWQGMLQWMKILGRSNSYIAELKWCKGRRHKKHWKHAWYVCCLMGTIYGVWAERNRRLFSEHKTSVEHVLSSIKYTISVSLLYRFPTLNWVN
ncbi:uncharacterized protein LOC141631780 [Silene latifolia]|uniref:uncharacterized protein LOC141631780 n=1 Tax=Silene latifolia TaxID=37657 RepID=UPI003D7817E6